MNQNINRPVLVGPYRRVETQANTREAKKVCREIRRIDNWVRRANQIADMTPRLIAKGN